MRESRISEAASIVMAICSVGVLGLVLWQRFAVTAAPVDPRPAIDTNTWRELVSAGHRLGPKNAPLQIVMFSDFQYPFCADFELNVLSPLRTEFPREFSVLFRHWPLASHPNARRLAIAAECASEQGRFAQFQHAVFGAQKELSTLAVDSLAAANDVQDLDQCANCIAEGRGSAIVDRDAALAEAIGSTGTPAVIIDGEWYPGGGPRVEQLREMIKEAAQ